MRAVLAAISLCVLTACASTPAAPPAQPSAPTAPPAQATPPAITFELAPARFHELPGWSQADAQPALLAFKRSCARLRARPADTALTGAARYGGAVKDWLPACAAADAAAPAQARAFFEANFRPYAVTSRHGEAKLTGYYEPVFEGRRAPEGRFSEPLLAKPTDMLAIDVSEFVKALEIPAERAPRGVWQGKVVGGRIMPYPARGELTPIPGQVLAYAHPADLYDLQVQGSGRVTFPDGGQLRAAWDGQNGRKWNSIFRTLRQRALILGPLNKNTVRAWMDSADPALVREVMNTDPSYVFFNLEAIDDPLAGPRGAQGVNLTPMGSIAVDPAYHPYGAVLFVDAVGPLANGDTGPFSRLLIAQDTGGAIRRGPLRGDVFFGVGEDAHALAARMNAPAPRWWTLLPNTMSPPGSTDVPVALLTPARSG
jgi:membrane-bound lytic murein transglycosylase A